MMCCSSKDLFLALASLVVMGCFSEPAVRPCEDYAYRDGCVDAGSGEIRPCTWATGTKIEGTPDAGCETVGEQGLCANSGSDDALVAIYRETDAGIQTLAFNAWYGFDESWTACGVQPSEDPPECMCGERFISDTGFK